MAELNLNHIGQDTLTVTAIPANLPRCRAQDGKGNYANLANGQPQYLEPRHALIRVTGNPVRWRADGIDPVSAPGGGQPYDAGSYISWTDPLGDFALLIQRVRFVKAEGATGNPVLEISYFA